MAYATVAEYKALYDTDMPDARLSAWLEKASRKIDASLAKRGAVLPDQMGEELESLLADTCTDMVHRVAPSGQSSMPDGMTSYSQGGNGFTESYTFAAYSSLKVRSDELDAILALLGLQSGGVGFGSWLGGD